MTAATATQSTTPAMPEQGQKAPAFAMPNQDGATTKLTELKGKKVVLYFYPKDDTPGCTTEAKDFRDLAEKFAQANTVLYGVSKDDAKSHVKFRDKLCLPFDLLTDNGETCDAYGVWVEKSMYGKKYMGIQRATFLIDAEGKIAKVWPKVSVTGHAMEVLDAAEDL